MFFLLLFLSYYFVSESTFKSPMSHCCIWNQEIASTSAYATAVSVYSPLLFFSWSVSLQIM